MKHPRNDPQLDNGCFFYKEEDVIVGKSGILFLYNGGHRVFDYCSGAIHASSNAIHNFRSNLASRSTLCQNEGIAFYQVIIPDKQSVLVDEFPLENPISHVDQFLDESWALQQCIVNLKEYLRELGKDAWLKGDTHLKPHTDAMIAWKLHAGIEQDETESEFNRIIAHPFEVAGYVGDLSSKIADYQHYVEETIIRYRRPWITAHQHNTIPGGNNGLIDIHVSANAARNKRVLFFGDSFGRSIAWYLSYFYQHVLFCRTPFCHYEMISMFKPDIMICQNIERYLPSTRSDDDRPNFLLYGSIGRHHGKEVAPREFYQLLNAQLSYPRLPFIDKVTKLGIKV